MYRVEIKKKAVKDIDVLSQKERKRVFAALDVLRINPFVGKKLHGDHAGSWSLRVWPYRILYAIDKKIVTVFVFRVAHRQGVYG